MSRPRICLVGICQPSFNPRLVREADSLMQAGYDVRVVATHHLLWADAREEALMRKRQWRLQRVDLRPVGWNKLYSGMIRGRNRLVAGLRPYFKSSDLGFLAYGLAGPELTKIAASEPSDWFIAHSHAALPVAAAAAARWNARFGFDCEDLLAHAPGEPREFLRAIEAKYLPQLCLRFHRIAAHGRTVGARPPHSFAGGPLQRFSATTGGRDARAARASRRCHCASALVRPDHRSGPGLGGRGGGTGSAAR